MEWIMPVNEILSDEITKLNHKMIPPGFRGDVRSVRVMQDCLSKLIDQLGEQSMAAQGLHKVITTAEKLRHSPTYTLYLLKDGKAKDGKGEVIGMLKVGRKHLFLFDERERVREVEPLCVLDFYVLQDRQRHGYGRQLFDYMLHDMEVMPHMLAVDGPSPKMETFLTKNYNLGRLVRQNNNFAVSTQFFDNLEEIRLKAVSLPRQIVEDHKGRLELNKVSEASKSGCNTPVSPDAVGRFSAPKPLSSIANIIHGGGELSASPVEALPEESAREEAPVPAEPSPEPEPEPEPVVPEAVVDEEPRGLERPCTLQVEAVAATASSPAAPSPAGSTVSRRDSQLTDKGFFDVKFYHNKLWCGCFMPIIPYAVGRYSAPKPLSSIASIIHGDGEISASPVDALPEESARGEAPVPAEPSPEPEPEPEPVETVASTASSRAAQPAAGFTLSSLNSSKDVKYCHNKLW